MRPLGQSRDFEQAEKDPDLVHATRALSALSRAMDLYQEEAFQGLLRELTGAPTVLVGSTLAFPMRCLRELYGVPMVTVHLKPSVIRSTLDPPLGTRRPRLPQWLPRFLVRGMWWAMDTWIFDPQLARPHNRLRAKLGLAPVRGILGDWLQQADLTLGLFPDWFRPPPADWPVGLKLSNFPLWDQENAQTLPEGLEAFLQEGEPPVVFTAGSCFATMRPFYQDCLQACRQLGCRGLLLSRHASNIPPDLPANVRHYSYAPFSKLLPRVAALVHHGGIGTMSQALAAGIPQVVIPQAHDQFDNAHRAQLLGVSRTGQLLDNLARVLHSPAIQERARELAPRVQSGLSDAADSIEGLLQTYPFRH